jgi:hypothetical protein
VIYCQFTAKIYPYPRWCRRTAGVTPPPTRLG